MGWGKIISTCVLSHYNVFPPLQQLVIFLKFFVKPRKMVGEKQNWFKLVSKLVNRHCSRGEIKQRAKRVNEAAVKILILLLFLENILIINLLHFHMIYSNEFLRVLIQVMM